MFITSGRCLLAPLPRYGVLPMNRLRFWRLTEWTGQKPCRAVGVKHFPVSMSGLEEQNRVGVILDTAYKMAMDR